jgi:hypothetical protein
MNKRIITGAVIALAAGLAAFIYNRKRNRLNEAAADAYNAMDNAIDITERETEHSFS